jgi:predicted anti-sigma-YlaC factor YlaD
MTMHDKWTDQLSDYLDGELSPDEEAAIESHLGGCAACAEVLNDLKRVIARAQAIEPRPLQADLWRGVAARIEAGAPARVVSFRTPMPARRFAFTVPQLAAAGLLIAAMSGGLAWSIAERAANASRAAEGPRSVEASRASGAVEVPAAEPDALAEPSIETVSLADAQYDAAVAVLERALKQGRGRLDPATIATVEHNLETIDQAIQQAREALAGDPANTYLSSHLVEARRRKLDLLRRATALTTTESD